MLGKQKRRGIWMAYILIIALAIMMIGRMAYLALSDDIGNIHYDDPKLSETLVRGSIYDRNGELLAIRAPDYGFEIKLIDTVPSFVASVISSYTTEPAISIENRIENGETFIMISMIPTLTEMDEISTALREKGLADEVRLTTHETRKYPKAETMSEIVGRTDEDLTGISGIELLVDSELTAKPSPYERIVHGNDVTLTIDSVIQYELLEIAPPESTIAILSPEGELLAYAGELDYDVLSSTVKSIDTYYGTSIDFIRHPFPYDTEILENGYQIYTKNLSDVMRRLIILLLLNAF